MPLIAFYLLSGAVAGEEALHDSRRRRGGDRALGEAHRMGQDPRGHEGLLRARLRRSARGVCAHAFWKE